MLIIAVYGGRIFLFLVKFLPAYLDPANKSRDVEIGF